MLEYFLLYLGHRFKHSLDEMSKAFISLTSPGTKNYFKLFKYLNSRAKMLIDISNNTTEFLPQMYTGGKLLFADHIFNGYGNAKKDFLKQV